MGEFLSVRENVEYAKKAEDHGLSSAWITEHCYYRDAIVSATAILAQTRRIDVGTSIVNPFTRHPALLAMTAATLNEFSEGRFILGLGLGIPLWNDEQMGIPMGSPNRSLREASEITRLLLRGNTARVQGERFRAMDVKLGFDIAQNPARIYLAGVRPQLLRTAARFGDGVILSACSTVSYVRNSLPFIEQGLKESGRSSIEVTCLAYLSISNDSEKARRDIKPWLFTILMRPGREDLILSDNPKQQAKVKAAKEAMADGDRENAMKLISDDIVDSISIVGNKEECLESIDRYRGSGVTELVLIPVTPSLNLLEDLMNSLEQS